MTAIFVRRWAVLLLLLSPVLLFACDKLVSLQGSHPLVLMLCVATAAKLMVGLVYALAVISFLLILFPEIWVVMVRLTAPADDSPKKPSNVTNLREWDKHKVMESRHPKRHPRRGA